MQSLPFRILLQLSFTDTGCLLSGILQHWPRDCLHILRKWHLQFKYQFILLELPTRVCKANLSALNFPLILFRHYCFDPTLSPTICPAGSWSSGGIILNCTTCPAGSYCASGSSRPAPCAFGYYSLIDSSTCTICPAGYSCLDPTEAPILCGTGLYSLQGQAICAVCPAGSVSFLFCSYVHEFI